MRSERVLGLNTTRNDAAGQIAICAGAIKLSFSLTFSGSPPLSGWFLPSPCGTPFDLVGIRVLGHAEDVVKLGIALMSGKGVFEPWSAAEVDGRRRGRRAKKKIQEETDVGSVRRPSGARACRRNASDDCSLAGLSATLESGEFTTKLALKRRLMCLIGGPPTEARVTSVLFSCSSARRATN